MCCSVLQPIATPVLQQLPHFFFCFVVVDKFGQPAQQDRTFKLSEELVTFSRFFDTLDLMFTHFRCGRSERYKPSVVRSQAALERSMESRCTSYERHSRDTFVITFPSTFCFDHTSHDMEVGSWPWCTRSRAQDHGVAEGCDGGSESGQRVVGDVATQRTTGSSSHLSSGA